MQTINLFLLIVRPSKNLKSTVCKAIRNFEFAAFENMSFAFPRVITEITKFSKSNLRLLTKLV